MSGGVRFLAAGGTAGLGSAGSGRVASVLVLCVRGTSVGVLECPWVMCASVINPTVTYLNGPHIEPTQPVRHRATPCHTVPHRATPCHIVPHRATTLPLPFSRLNPTSSITATAAAAVAVAIAAGGRVRRETAQGEALRGWRSGE